MDFFQFGKAVALSLSKGFVPVLGFISFWVPYAI